MSTPQDGSQERQDARLLASGETAEVGLAANCDCVASCAQSRPSGLARAPRSAPARTTPHAHRSAPNVVPTRGFKSLKSLLRIPETAEVGLTSLRAEEAGSGLKARRSPTSAMPQCSRGLPTPISAWFQRRATSMQSDNKAREGGGLLLAQLPSGAVFQFRVLGNQRVVALRERRSLEPVLAR